MTFLFPLTRLLLIRGFLSAGQLLLTVPLLGQPMTGSSSLPLSPAVMGPKIPYSGSLQEGMTAISKYDCISIFTAWVLDNDVVILGLGGTSA